MRTLHVVTVLPILGLFITGCGPRVIAPQTPDGSKIVLLTFFNGSIRENMDEAKKEDQMTLGALLDKDMSRRLDEGGFETRRIQSVEELSSAPGVYLIVTDLTEYQSNELYSQDETRLGNGVTTISATVELFKDNHTLPIMRRSERTVCTRDWTFCVLELNRNMTRAVSERINELY
jgi:hypothetical protein